MAKLAKQIPGRQWSGDCYAILCQVNKKIKDTIQTETPHQWREEEVSVINGIAYHRRHLHTWNLHLLIVSEKMTR